MKKLLCSVLLLVLAFTFAACRPKQGTDQSSSYGDDVHATPTAEPVKEDEVDCLTMTWVMAELVFTSKQQYPINEKAEYQAVIDAVFTNRNTGTSLIIPAFWDGESTWRVRFAPTEAGIWDYKTISVDDPSLNELTGTVGANAYTGDLAVYKHGFVTTKYGKKYFTYDDGTPFFYLGDTHWSMYAEEYDKAGPYAGNTGATSHFKYIVDKRVAQGYTVYQSEPISAPFNLSAGKISKRTVKDFQKADDYYFYIAEKGLTHANAEFFFSSDITPLANKDEVLETLSRYWVARFGAFPVMWTLGQEIDNDFYAENADGKAAWDYTNNPWLKVAEYLHKYDAYHHPLSGHQEGSSNTTVTGKGLEGYDVAGQNNGKKVSNGGASIFLSEEVTKKTGHDWWAAQWKQNVNILPNFVSARDYWDSGKVSVNYEDRYVNLWTDDFGARARGWISYLNGFYGYGYGCIDIWYYNSSYDMDKDTVRQDGRSVITKADKAMKWSSAVELDSGYQVAYMKQFFNLFDWWKLTPDFDGKDHFVPLKRSVLYSCATIGDEVFVVYSYNEDKNLGTVLGLDKDAEYSLLWFNPREGQFNGHATTIRVGCVNEKGVYGYEVTEKPDANDWVLYLIKK